MTSEQYSEMDREIVVLSAIWDLIGSMVHYAHFEREHPIEEATLLFKTRECSEVFIILLADFLSLPKSGTFGLRHQPGQGSTEKTYLGSLLRICENPHFRGDTSLLQSSSRAFAGWLDGSITVDKVWLPSIDRDGPLTIQRLAYLKICGTISKHGFTRLGDVVKKLQELLRENGTIINEGQSYLLIPEFQEWFRDHVFIASSSAIAFYLNEIRWGIYQYLRAEFERSYRPCNRGGVPSYRFEVPTDITKPLIESMYWELMNGMIKHPYFPRFTVQRYLMKEF